jgi:hypothetical protein
MSVMERTHGRHQRDRCLPGAKAVDGSPQRGRVLATMGVRGIGLNQLGMAVNRFAT